MADDPTQPAAPENPTSEPQGAQAVDDDALEFATGGTGLSTGSGGEPPPPAINTTYTYGSTASIVKPVNTTLT